MDMSPKARMIDDGEAERCEIRWQRVEMSKQAQAEWLVSAVRVVVAPPPRLTGPAPVYLKRSGAP